jgi:hypothetical protein
MFVRFPIDIQQCFSFSIGFTRLNKSTSDVHIPPACLRQQPKKKEHLYNVGQEEDSCMVW